MLTRESYIEILSNKWIRPDQRAWFEKRLAVITLKAPQPHPMVQRSYEVLCEKKMHQKRPVPPKTIFSSQWGIPYTPKR